MDMPLSHREDVFQKLGRYTLEYPRRIFLFFIILLLFLLGLQFILNAFYQKKHDALPTPVVISASKIEDVPIFFSALGTVTPDITVTVRTQINGTLTHLYFRDGQFVKAGDVLAQIDPRIYQAQILQYQGSLLRDQALLINAQHDLTRYQHLYQTRAVSEQTLNTQQSLVQQYEGAIKIDQGLLGGAQTNLAYCTITSPVTGRIGISIIDQGNFVQTSDANGIGVITTLDPMDIVFPLPEKDLAAVVAPFSLGNKLAVLAYDADQEKIIAEGALKAIDNQVNLSTGTVNFKAEFSNPKNALFPNQFVNIKLKVNTLKNAIVVPTGAVQEGNDGPYVYRYNQNNTVNYVLVKTGPSYQGKTVITEGVSNNESVVIEGADKLFNGAAVVIPGNHKK